MRIIEFINKYIPKRDIFDTHEILKNFPIGSLNLLRTYKSNYKLCDQIGGDEIKTISLNTNKYEYRIDEYETPNGDYLFNLITLDAEKNLQDDFAESDNCGYMIINKEQNEGTVQSLSNYQNCLKCIEKTIKFNFGDIIMQIMIIDEI